MNTLIVLFQTTEFQPLILRRAYILRLSFESYHYFPTKIKTKTKMYKT